MNSANEKKNAKKRSCLQPVPKVLVSCRGLDGEDNVLAVVCCCNCSYDPPMVMVGIVPTRYSYKMIKESGCFVVNLVPDSIRKRLITWEAIASAMGTSWRDESQA
jgi:flavin reductase (DIM6/NTAB) family NADH-FMN oxidoreductase RutF